MSAQVKANSIEIDLGLTHAAGHAETADSSIPHAAEHELKRRSNIAKSKISKLMRSLKGYDIVSEERSPFKISHRSLESSGEIIARRKRVKQAQELFAQRGSRNRWKPPTSPMERQMRLSLGLEKTEDCAMCTQTFPKGTLKHEVTKKAIYEWRRLQKKTRVAKWAIRRAVMEYGEGGCAYVFREALHHSRKNDRSSTPPATGMSMTITYDQFWDAMKTVFKVSFADDVCQRIQRWLDRDQDGCISYMEFANLLEGNSIQARKEKKREQQEMQLHESAGDESAETSFENDEALERYPQVALKILDKTQPEMSNVEDRLLHTLYTTTKVCAFCHQLFDDVPAIARRQNSTRVRVEEYTSWVSPHQPWTQADDIDGIERSLLLRRSAAPFETHDEFKQRSKISIHALSFNHVHNSRRAQRPAPASHSSQYAVAENHAPEKSREKKEKEKKKIHDDASLKARVDELYRKWRASGIDLDTWEEGLENLSLEEELDGTAKLLFNRQKMKKASRGLHHEISLINELDANEQAELVKRRDCATQQQKLRAEAATSIQSCIRKFLAKATVRKKKDHLVQKLAEEQEAHDRQRSKTPDKEQLKAHETRRKSVEKNSRKIAARRSKRQQNRQMKLLGQLDNL